MASRQQQQMEELASQLSDTLALHFPDGPPPHNEELVKRWLAELANSDAVKKDGVSADEVMRMAVKRWKASDSEPTSKPKSTAKVGATSFSLLDQLSAMPKRVFYDEIEAASTPAERLKLLQQVDHVDDVASDWTQVLELLYNGLTEDDNASEYLELHRKWSKQCSSSIEYASLQHGLCNNLVKALRLHFGHNVHVAHSNGLNFSSNDIYHHLFAMMQLWHSIWMSANFSADDRRNMALQVMVLMRNLGAPTKHFVLLPAHFMALIDPYADWFAHWIRHHDDVTPMGVVNDLEESGLIYDILQRTRDEGTREKTIPDTSDESSNTSTDFTVIPEGSHVQVSSLERALLIHSLCILRGVLAFTRVYLFPWDAVDKQTRLGIPYTCLLESISPQVKQAQVDTGRKATVPSVDVVLSIMNPFVTVLQQTGTGQVLVTYCCEALETILWGLEDEAMLYETLQALLDRLNGQLPPSMEVGEELFAMLARLHFSGRAFDTETRDRLLLTLKVLWEHCLQDLGSFEITLGVFGSK